MTTYTAHKIVLTNLYTWGSSGKVYDSRQWHGIYFLMVLSGQFYCPHIYWPAIPPSEELGVSLLYGLTIGVDHFPV